MLRNIAIPALIAAHTLFVAALVNPEAQRLIATTAPQALDQTIFMILLLVLILMDALTIWVGLLGSEPTSEPGRTQPAEGRR